MLDCVVLLSSNTRWYLLFVLTIRGAVVCLWATTDVWWNTPVMVDLHRLRGLVVLLLLGWSGWMHTSRGLGCWSHVLLDLIWITWRLNCSHSLAERYWDDLPVANILKQDLWITYYQRVRNIQLIFQLVIVHRGLKVHATVSCACLSEISTSPILVCCCCRLNRTYSTHGTRHHRVLLRTIRIQKHLLLLIECRESIQSCRVVIVDACVSPNVLSGDFLCIGVWERRDYPLRVMNNLRIMLQTRHRVIPLSSCSIYHTDRIAAQGLLTILVVATAQYVLVNWARGIIHLSSLVLIDPCIINHLIRHIPGKIN